MNAQTYLSTSNGKWRVIHQGVPLCADTDKLGAEKCAQNFKYDPVKLPVWNGDLGKWETT